MESLWPEYRRMRLMEHELAWGGEGVPEGLRGDVWWARYVLRRIPRHERAWVPISKLQRYAGVCIGGEPAPEAFRLAARRMGARVREDAVGCDVRVCDRLYWELVESATV